MAEGAPRRDLRRVSIARHPIYAMLLPVCVTCFVGVLLTDLTYLGSGGNLVWLDFSSWLLLAGLVFGVLAALVLIIDVARSAHMRSAAGWALLLLFFAGLLVELLSMFVHQRDGWTAVAGLGLVLSIVGALLVLAAAWVHRPAVEAAR
ncbi:MAG TPA: DUF2231 domain-containing protein [Sphingomicrobium sp.]